MGWTTNHSITVTSWNGELIIKAQAHIREMLEGGVVWVSNVSPPGVNGERSFFLAPDGSKEGWPESDLGDAERKRVTDWLKAQAYDDGSTSLQWVEVTLGGDDDSHDGPQIIDSSHHVYKRVRAETKLSEMKRAEKIEPLALEGAKTPLLTL